MCRVSCIRLGLAGLEAARGFEDFELLRVFAAFFFGAMRLRRKRGMWEHPSSSCTIARTRPARQAKNCRGDVCSGPSWISLVGLDGRGKKRLTKGDSPSWSPDGRFLAFYLSGTVTLAMKVGQKRRRKRNTTRITSEMFASSEIWTSLTEARMVVVRSLIF